MLHHMGDPDRIETACFAMIDPDSPIVEECGLLSEQLEALLRLIADNDAAGTVVQMMAIGSLRARMNSFGARTASSRRRDKS